MSRWPQFSVFLLLAFLNVPTNTVSQSHTHERVETYYEVIAYVNTVKTENT